MAALPASLIFGTLYEQLGSLIAFGTGSALALLAAGLLLGVKVQHYATEVTRP